MQARRPFPVDGLLPKQATKADAFLQRCPTYDGRGVRVAVLDTGVDPAALGLNGPNKVVDIIDCTGAGDVPLQTVEAQPGAESDTLQLTSPATGRTLLVSASWPNPTGVWKVGTKRAYDLWPTSLVERRTKERKEAFDVSHAKLLQQARNDLNEEEARLAKCKESAEKAAAAQRVDEHKARVAVLQDMHKNWHDPGPILDAVVFHDGTHWRAVVGGGEGDVTSPTEGESSSLYATTLDLRAHKRLTDYRVEREWSYFGDMDLLTYTVNILQDGGLLSIVTLSGTHGTHVAGIIGARTEEAATNGVAPGAEIVSLRIGDSRLGSMETGQALLRAAQALIDTKCDVANMSYGEDGGFTLEDKGAFAEALQRVIRDHHVCFVSSAGNNGPALTTVGQPGGTTSGVLSVGAYVNAGAMQQAEYALVETGVPSSVTTWCSRGPAADGASGVSIYAPGAAITSICRYALQSKQLMNGTSMSSPNAAGAVALLVSACKAEGIPVSPFRLFRAIEATGADVQDPLDVKFLDVEKAWEYLQAHRDDPYADAEMRVHVTPAGKPLGYGHSRGVYLREAEETHRTSQFNVTVQPTFSYGETQRSFALEIRASLQATAPWVHVPEFLVLGSNGRTFEIRVAADQLPPGLHSAKIVARDTERDDTVVLEVPITVAKPVVPLGATHILPHTHFASGDIRREFVQVPPGATWAEIRVRSQRHEAPGTSARFWLHLLQLEPQRRLCEVEHQYILALNENEPVTKRLPVQGGMTLEVCAAQFWSNKAGFELEWDLEFHGLGAPMKTLTTTSGQGWTSLPLRSELRVEECKPSVKLDTRRQFVRPRTHTIRALRDARDRQPSGHQLMELTVEYPITVKEATSLTWRLPLSGHLYDGSVTLLTQLLDLHQAQVHFGDVYPKDVSLKPGEYTLRVQALHESADVLEKLQNMSLTIDHKLKKEVALDVYADHLDLLGSGKPIKDAIKLLRGENAVVVIDTNLEGDKLPSEASAGDVLLGTVQLGGQAKLPLEVVVGPAPATSNDKAAPPSDPTPLPTLLAGLVSKVASEDKEAFLARLVSDHPESLPVRLAVLEACDAKEVDKTLQAAEGVQSCIDETALRLWLGTQQPPASEQTDEQKREAEKMQAQKKALAFAWLRQAQALAYRGSHDESAAAMKHAQQFIDEASDAKTKALLANLRTEWHRSHERFGLALQSVRKQLEVLGHATSDTREEWARAHELEAALLQQLAWTCWWKHTQRWSWLEKPAAPEPF
ncbi:serine-type endopeptidase [Malassezia pachydermatis]